MFESERAQIRILSNVADSQGLGRARDLLRQAEHEFKERFDWQQDVNRPKHPPVVITQKTYAD